MQENLILRRKSYTWLDNIYDKLIRNSIPACKLQTIIIGICLKKPYYANGMNFLSI